MKRELEREERDREFWISMFGGKSDKTTDIVVEETEGEVAFGTR